MRGNDSISASLRAYARRGLERKKPIPRVQYRFGTGSSFGVSVLCHLVMVFSKMQFLQLFLTTDAFGMAFEVKMQSCEERMEALPA